MFGVKRTHETTQANSFQEIPNLNLAPSYTATEEELLAEGWRQVSKKRNTATTPDRCETVPTDSQQPSTSHATHTTTTGPTQTTDQPHALSKFKTAPRDGETHYSVMSRINDKNITVKVTAREDSKGCWVLTPKDVDAYTFLKEQASLLEITPAKKETWAVVYNMPQSIQAKELLRLPHIKEAVRCTTRNKMPTTQVKITVVGPVPRQVDLGIFGSYPTRTWVPEPQRCHKCQRFGHHQLRCYGTQTCGVCSGPHDTTECTRKHKEGQKTTNKCPNCAGRHHAWNTRCPERLRRVWNLRETALPQHQTTPAVAMRRSPVAPWASQQHLQTAPPPLSQVTHWPAPPTRQAQPTQTHPARPTPTPTPQTRSATHTTTTAPATQTRGGSNTRRTTRHDPGNTQPTNTPQPQPQQNCQTTDTQTRQAPQTKATTTTQTRQAPQTATTTTPSRHTEMEALEERLLEKMASRMQQQQQATNEQLTSLSKQFHTLQEQITKQMRGHITRFTDGVLQILTLLPEEQTRLQAHVESFMEQFQKDHAQTILQTPTSKPAAQTPTPSHPATPVVTRDTCPTHQPRPTTTHLTQTCEEVSMDETLLTVSQSFSGTSTV